MGNKEIVWSRVIKAASRKRILNCLKTLIAFGLSSVTKRSFVWGGPAILTVEPTVRCNLHCPQCLTGRGEAQRDQDLLSLELFKQILEELGDRIWYLLLYNQGEPFLHPDFIEFIKLAKQKGIYITTSTNGHFFTDEVFVQQLVESGIDTIIISIDGANSETYLKYRYHGDFQRVISGIEKIIIVKKNLKSPLPKVFLQCLITRHNEHQVDQIKKLAKDIGVDRVLFKTFHLESTEHGIDFLPMKSAWRRYQVDDNCIKIKTYRKKGCFRLWYSTVILSDNRVVPCCFDKNGNYSFGKISVTFSLKQIWHSDTANKLRNKILQAKRTIDICHNCTQNQRIYV